MSRQGTEKVIKQRALRVVASNKESLSVGRYETEGSLHGRKLGVLSALLFAFKNTCMLLVVFCLGVALPWYALFKLISTYY